jgi:WD40 repeat protein
MKVFFTSLIGLLSMAALSQPASEVLLFELQLKKDNVVISHPKNITNHKGYDNQPSFHSDQPIIYYTSFNEDGRADIKYYDYKTGETKALTQTQEREYSPTLTPDKQYISCIIQRDNGAQDLGKYPVQGGEPLIILDNMIVGFHLWVDNSHLALFILGSEGKPHSLHYLRLPTKTDTIIAEGIGRSLHRVPGEEAFSFVHKITENKWFIKKFYPRRKKEMLYLIAETPPHREDICWTPDGKIIVSDDSKILWMDPKKEKKWKEVQVESGADQIKGATRLSVSPDGKHIAIVVAEQ